MNDSYVECLILSLTQRWQKDRVFLWSLNFHCKNDSLPYLSALRKKEASLGDKICRNILPQRSMFKQFQSFSNGAGYFQHAHSIHTFAKRPVDWPLGGRMEMASVGQTRCILEDTLSLTFQRVQVSFRRLMTRMQLTRSVCLSSTGLRRNYRCTICSVSLNSIEQYHAHLKGSKHQTKQVLSCFHPPFLLYVIFSIMNIG